MAAQLGLRLRSLREFYGWSQRELAKRAGVPNSAISVIEQGTVSPSVISLEKVLNGFPISLSDFFAIDIARQKVVQHPRQLNLLAGNPHGGVQADVNAEAVGLNLRLYSLLADDPPIKLIARYRTVLLIVDGEGLFSSLSFSQVLQKGDSLAIHLPTPFCVDALKGPVTWLLGTAGH